MQKRNYFVSCVMVFGLTLVLCNVLHGISCAADVEGIVKAHQETQGGMNLWQTIQSGGLVMIVLGLLSIAAVASIVYSFSTIKCGVLAPVDFSEDIIGKIEKGNMEAVRSLCKRNDNIIVKIINVGLLKREKGKTIAREAMENVTRKEIGALWQKISYLSDIASIAPLVGLLGTVLGMIQAFNVIAFQSAVVKPMLLAGGISKAMVTTAGGLIVAIPVMLFYSYFRGRVQEITDTVETYSSDIIRVIENQ